MALTQVQGGMLAGSSNTVTTIQSNGTTAITVDASQNVGIGTSSPVFPLQITGGAGVNSYAHFTNATTGNTASDGLSIGVASGATDAYIIQRESAPLNFYTNALERMRIDSSGDLLVGTSTQNTLDGGRLQVLQSADNCAVFRTTSPNYQIVCQAGQGSNTGNQISFRYSSSVVGNIVSTGSATAYNTSSDYRLKEDIAPMTGALDKVKELKPCTYTWKSTSKQGEGFIAHELAEVCPDAVTGEKDALDAKGNPQYQGIDVSFLVATLTAAIQELNAKVDAQALEIAALKATP